MIERNWIKKELGDAFFSVMESPVAWIDGK